MSDCKEDISVNNQLIVADVLTPSPSSSTAPTKQNDCLNQDLSMIQSTSKSTFEHPVLMKSGSGILDPESTQQSTSRSLLLSPIRQQQTNQQTETELNNHRSTTTKLINQVKSPQQEKSSKKYKKLAFSEKQSSSTSTNQIEIEPIQFVDQQRRNRTKNRKNSSLDTSPDDDDDDDNDQDDSSSTTSSSDSENQENKDLMIRHLNSDNMAEEDELLSVVGPEVQALPFEDPIEIRGNGNMTLFGLSNCYQSTFPSALLGRVSKEEFEYTINRINHLLQQQHSTNAKFLLLGCLCCCFSLGCSLLWPTFALSRRTKNSLEKLLAMENSRLYNKLGLNWRLCKQPSHTNHSFMEYILVIDFLPKMQIYQPD